jgi:hypothetical protein
MGVWKETFIAESRELPVDGLQFVGVSGRDEITDNRGHYFFGPNWVVV